MLYPEMCIRDSGNIMIISHQERILNIADTIVVLKAGRIDAVGPRSEILPGILNSAASGACRVLTDRIEGVTL